MEYVIVDQIGKGSGSDVFLVRRNNTDLYFAMKKFRDVSKGKKEAELLKNLNHPAIPKVSDYFAEGDSFYLIMEYEEGISLKRMVETGHDNIKGNVGKQAEEIIRELAEILKYLHTLPVPVIHSDLKPENILITDSFKVKLLDFGASFRISDSEKEIHSTPGYAAPEIQNGECTRRSDVYSFGMVMIYLLTHKTPDTFNATPTMETLIRLGMEEEYAQIASKSVRIKPQERYASGKELKRAIDHVKTGGNIKSAVKNSIGFVFTDFAGVLALSGLGFFFLRNRYEAKFSILAGCLMLIIKLITDSVKRNKTGSYAIQEYSLYLEDK